MPNRTLCAEKFELNLYYGLNSPEIYFPRDFSVFTGSSPAFVSVEKSRILNLKPGKTSTGKTNPKKKIGT